MALSRIYGPYPARKGYRLVVLQGGARKSLIAATQEAADKLRADLEQALKRRGELPIGDVLKEYEDYLQRARGARTAPHITRAIARFLDDTTALGAITPARAAALYEAETRRLLEGSGQPVAAASHRTLLGQCKRFYAWAVERGYATRNPFAAVKPMGRPKVGKTQLRIDEARAFVSIAVSKAQKGEPGAIAALMALLLGLRAGEVLGRVVRDLDDGGRVLWITRGKTDNARRRLEVPEILRPLLSRLCQHKTPEAFIFGDSPIHKAQPLSDAWLWGQVRKLCDEAGVPRVSTHSLRGLHSTLAVEAGVTSSAVAAALGHGSFQITAKHYTAPGTVERVRAKSVEKTLQAVPDAADPIDLYAADPARLFAALKRMPPDFVAALRRALSEES